MKTLFVFLFVIFNTLSLFSVENEEADVSITLTKPAKFTYDKFFTKQVDSLNKVYRKDISNTKNRAEAIQMLDSLSKSMKKKLLDSSKLSIVDFEDAKSQYENINNFINDKIKLEEYLQKVDFYENIDYSHEFIRCYERYINYFVTGYYTEYIKSIKYTYEKNENEISIEKYIDICNKYQSQFVLNVKSINLRHIKNKNTIELGLQLFNNETKSILIDTVFVSDDNNHGFEFSCKEGTIDCFIKNTIFNSYKLLINKLIQFGYGPRRVIELGNKRYQITSDLLNKNYNKSYLKNVLETEKKQNNLDSNINIEKMYYALINDSSTKFVAFFNDYISFEDRNKLGRVVNIETRYDIRDSNYFKDHPQMATYIVKGEKYKDKWYLEKPSVNLVQADDFLVSKQNLLYKTLKDSYFTYNDTTFNNQFWDIGLFEKVEDISQTNKANKKYNTYENKDNKYKNYVGVTKYIANRLSKLEEIVLMNYLSQKELEYEGLLNAATTYLRRKHGDSILFFKDRNYRSMIYDSSFNNILIPFVIKKEKLSFEIQCLYYDNSMKRTYEFTITNGKIFKIINKNAKKIDTKEINPSLVEYFETFYPWNWSMKYVNDRKFWNDIIKAKLLGSYKYLKEIKLEE